MRALALPLAAGLLLATTGVAHTHIVSDREVLLIRALPAGLIARLGDAPDSLGYVRPNQNGRWLHVELQEPGLPRLMDACARADSAAAEACWPVIDAAMRHQRPPGDYEAAAAEPTARKWERTAWWIGELCRAEIAVMNSPLQERFRWRVTLLLPKLRRSVDWLVAAGDTLLDLHRARGDLLLVDAQAFLLADGIYHDPRMAALGQRALTAALALQARDGAIGGDVGAQARAVTALGELATYFPMPMLEDASVRACHWLDRRFGEAERRGGPTAAARREALLAMAFHAERVRDTRLRERVEQWSRKRTQSR